MTLLLNNRYRIVQVLGEGGCGQTFLAEDDHLPSKRQCVVKQLKPKTSNPDSYQIIRDRFEREAVILEKLGDANDQIPQLYAYFTEAQQFYLVQELVKGSTLTQRLGEARNLDEATACEMLINLLPVLSYIHSQGIIHRDINPNNIILRERDGKPVLIDFGIVKEMVAASADSTGSHTDPTIIGGTPGYMPPEQGTGRPVYASDLYSLAMTAIHLLTGRNPRELYDQASGEIVWRQYAPHLSAGFAAVLDRAVADDFRQRYKTAQQMLDDLLRIQKPDDASVEEKLATMAPELLIPAQVVFNQELTAAAYRAQRKNGKQFIVIGAEAGTEFDYVSTPVFDRDGNVAAYAASLFYERTGFKEFIVVGKRAGQEFDFAGAPVWSQDGKTLAHQAGTGGRRFMVVGEKREAEFDFVGTPVWCPDGQSVAYAAQSRGKWRVVWGNNRAPEFDYAGAPVFNPKGTVVAYPARAGRRWFMVLWDKRGPEFDYVREPVFSPNGSVIAYAAEKNGKQFIVTGDQTNPNLKYSGSYVLSPDGSTVASHSQIIVIGDRTGGEFDFVSEPVWNQDGTRLAYAAGEGQQQFVVAGEERGSAFDYVRQPVWNSDGSALAYPACARGRWFVVLNDKSSPEFDAVGRLCFSPNDGKLLFGARSGREIWRRTMTL